MRNVAVAAAASILALVLAVPASAQEGMPSGMEPGVPKTPPRSAPHKASRQDRNFVHQAAFSGMAEVENGRIAAGKATNDMVKEYANRMIQDHTGVNQQLGMLAKAAKIDLPKKLDRDHKAMQERMQKLSGAEFDRAYIRSEMGEHEKAMQLFEKQADAGQDPALKGFASDVLPALRDHLEMARSIESSLPAAVPQTSRRPGDGQQQQRQQR